MTDIDRAACSNSPRQLPNRLPAKRRATRASWHRQPEGWRRETTTAINLGTALAAIGDRVLIVDLDPQGNASTGLGIDRKHRTLDLRRAPWRRAAARRRPADRGAAPPYRGFDDGLSGLDSKSASSAIAPFGCAAPFRRSTKTARPTLTFWSTARLAQSAHVNAMAAGARFSCRCNANSSRSKVCRNC